MTHLAHLPALALALESYASPYWLVFALTLLTQLFIFVRWLHRLVRDSEIERAFLRDTAFNHLPHIYHAIELIALHLKVPLADPPPLRFLDLDDHDARAKKP